MAEAIIGLLVGRLQEIAVGEAGVLVAVSNDIQRLSDKLIWVQALLREVGNKSRGSSNEVTRVWLQQMRGAVFDAVDAIDHYHHHLRGPSFRRWPRWLRPTMRSLPTFTIQVLKRHDLSRKIKAINRRLDDINENKDKYMIMEDADKKIDFPWTRSTSDPFPFYTYTTKWDELKAVIYTKEHKELKEALVTLPEQQESHDLVVISVFGESGVGKTTLVRDIYNRIAKMKEFELQAMETFQPYLTATDILQQIANQLNDDRNCSKHMARKMLEDKLRGKKYLLVIDGEVSVTEWWNILTSLPVGTRGSRIVHITQFKPEDPPRSYHHVTIQLNRLKEDAVMSLFRMMLPMELQYKNFKKYQNDIFQITQGLALAVVLLSGLVQSKEFPSEWVKVFDYLKSKQSARLQTMVSVCYEDLPYELKCCFLYFAAFPTNTIIEARNLVFMWVADAEGFIRPKRGRSIERIGFKLLNELINRNLVQLVTTDDYSTIGFFLTIQKRVHDFLKVEAYEASFMVVHSPDDSPTLTGVHRLCLNYCGDNNIYSVMANPLPKLRSIFCEFVQGPKGDQGGPKGHQGHKSRKNRAYTFYSHQPETIISDLFQGSEFLRVINLQGIEIGEVLTSAIGNVVHLQYLGITSCSLRYIPRSIRRLTRLQTLDVRETNVRELPRAFWMIKTLRHVLAFALKLPKEIGNLKQLRTLDSINLEDLELSLDETLGEMIHLEFLSVGNISEVNVKALSGVLDNLENLRTLFLQGKIIPSNVFTTFSLWHLHHLFLNGDLIYSSNLDDWEALCIPNLITLSLEKTYVTQEFISKLAELPFLDTLALHPGSYKDRKLVFSSSRFQRLRKIKITDVEVLDWVEIDVSMVPELKELEIQQSYSSCYQHIDVGNGRNRAKPTRIIVDVKKGNVVYEESVDLTRWWKIFS